LEEDYNTVAGLGFYEHGETPGLGGEVDNPKWKGLWPGKEIYDDGEVAIQLVKGNVDSSTPGAVNKVDGLSGATLTSRGVSNLLQFWMGALGYQEFLRNLRQGEA
jgi:Na+-transporting NADH:ubiquinone oxidoreductase subunit C